MPEKILFVGLGVMGYHMAGHLSKHTEISVFNRTSAKAKVWANEHKGSVTSSLHNLPSGITTIITCIGNDKDLAEVYLSEQGLIQQCQAGTLLIDHTTASAEIAQKIASAAQKKGIGFIDAPVSGGEQGAINGQLTIMCGGSTEHYDRAKPMIAHYARAISLLGPSGAGQMTKMCNQIAIAGLVQGLAESIHFAEQAGLDATQVIDVISKGAAQSWQMENRHSTMIKGEYEHGFAVDLMRKDLDICLSTARQINAKLPVTALVDQFYADVQDMGGNRWDTSSLLKRLRNKQ